MAVDPLTLALTGGTIVGGILSAGEQRRVAQENLAFQKWLANEELKMGRASRTDANGNTVRYDPALNQWVTDLTPEQRAIQKAGEHEQQLALTEDAGRNRTVRERAFTRAQGAADDYDRTHAEFAYGNNPSEGDIQNQIADLMLRGRRGGTGGQNPNQFIRQRGNMPVVSGSGYQSPISDIADALLKSRSAALGERGQRLQQRNALLPQMQAEAAMSDAGGGAPVSFPNFNNLFASEGNQASLAQTGMTAGGRGVQAAEAQLGKIGYGLPSISDLSKLNTMFNPKATGKVDPIASSTSYTSPDSRSLDEIMYDF